jgi:hypothetical protein
LLVAQAKANTIRVKDYSPCAACIRRGGSLRGEALINKIDFLSALEFKILPSPKKLFAIICH